MISPVDVVLANPPFGTVKEDGRTKVYDLRPIIGLTYETAEIDHAIALQSLAAMKDGGRAVLILGGVSKMVTTPEARSDVYQGQAKRLFYKALYDKYRVTDHFTVAGQLYERQGAGWPVDVIVIDGRGKSPLPLPAVEAPRIYKSWDELGGLINGQQTTGGVRPDRDETGVTPESGPGLETGGKPDTAAELEVGEVNWSSPQAFVDSLELALPELARVAVARGQGPKVVDQADDPVELVNSLLP